MDRVVEDEPQDIVIDRADPSAPPVAERHNSKRSKSPQGFTHDGARDAEIFGDSRFRRDRVAYAQLTFSDSIIDGADGALDPSSLNDRQQSRNLYDRFL